MREPLLRLAAEARSRSTAAHRAWRNGSLALDRDGQYVLVALGDAATGLVLLAEQLERLAAQAGRPGQKGSRS